MTPLPTQGGTNDIAPWYTPRIPWAFFGPPSRRKLINNGVSPQPGLAQNERCYGFSLAGNFGLRIGGAASGPKAATVGNVLNGSAAAFSSSGAFSPHNKY